MAWINRSESSRIGHKKPLFSLPCSPSPPRSLSWSPWRKLLAKAEPFPVKMPSFRGKHLVFSPIFLHSVAPSCLPTQLTIRGTLSLPTSAFKTDELVNVWGVLRKSRVLLLVQAEAIYTLYPVLPNNCEQRKINRFSKNTLRRSCILCRKRDWALEE